MNSCVNSLMRQGKDVEEMVNEWLRGNMQLIQSIQ